MVESSLDDFIEHKTKIIIEIGSENTGNCVISNRDEVPVRTSVSKAHGQLKSYDRSIDDGYIGIHVKNDNIYKSGYNNIYSSRQQKF